MFCLDSLDGLQYFWHDLRKEPERFSKGIQEGRSVMVLAEMSYRVKIDLVEFNVMMDSE